MRSRAGLEAAIAVFVVAAVACGAPDPPDAPARKASAESATQSENRPPAVRSVRIEPREPVPGERVRARIQVVDPEGDEVVVGYRWTLAGRPLPSGEAELELPEAARGAAIVVTVTASDGEAESEPVRAEARVGNRPPELAAVTLEPAGEVAPGKSVVALVDARDADRDPVTLRYRWSVNGRSVEGRRASFATEGLRRGDTIEVAVVASDGERESEPRTSAPVRIANAAPVIVSQPGSLSREGHFRYPVQVRDPDDRMGLRYRLVVAPPGMEIDSVLGQVVWKPAASQSGQHDVEIAVSDPQGAETRQRFQLTVREVEQKPASAPASAGP